MKILIGKNKVFQVQEVSYAFWDDDLECLSCFCPDNKQLLHIMIDYDRAMAVICEELFKIGFADLFGYEFDWHD